MLNLSKSDVAIADADLHWIGELTHNRASLGLGSLPQDSIAIKYNGQTAANAFSRALPTYKALIAGAARMGDPAGAVSGRTVESCCAAAVALSSVRG